MGASFFWADGRRAQASERARVRPVAIGDRDQPSKKTENIVMNE
jgi:hypothetical protein